MENEVIYIDAAEFSKRTLHQINRSSRAYQAQTAVIVVRPSVFNHYVSSFKKAGTIWS
jgi:hypothetical protein